MRAHCVVIGAPDFQCDARVRERAEQSLVEQLVPQAADERLDERVLGRLARRDVVPSDLVVIGPSQDRIAGQFGAVVADDRRRLGARSQEPVEFACNP
jgi:hypothetical protein